MKLTAPRRFLGITLDGRGRELLRTAWPIFVEQGLNVLTGVVDVFMISSVSDGAVAALSVANQLAVWFVLIFQGVAIGATVVVTHHLGAQDRPGADRVAVSAVAMCLWLGLAASALVASTARPLLELMQLPASLFVYAQPFLVILGAGLVFMALNMGMGAVLRAHGHAREVMLVGVLMNVVNIIGNAIALFGWFGLPVLGVEGVAVSTVFSRALATAVLAVLLARQLGIRLRWRQMLDVRRERVARVLRIGGPVAGGSMSWRTAFMVVTTFTAQLGEQPLAAQSYWITVTGLMVMVSVSIGSATEILIGRLVGAGEFDDVYGQLMRSLRLALVLTAGVAIAVALASPWIAGSLTRDAVVLGSTVLLLRLAIVLESGRIFNIVVAAALRAAGDTRYAFQVGTVLMWAVWIPLAWSLALGLGWGLVGIWIACTFDEWLRGLLLYRRWRRRTWMKYAERTRDSVHRIKHEAMSAGDPA